MGATAAEERYDDSRFSSARYYNYGVDEFDGLRMYARFINHGYYSLVAVGGDTHRDRSFNKPQHQEQSVRELSKNSGVIGFRLPFCFFFGGAKKKATCHFTGINVLCT